MNRKWRSIAIIFLVLVQATLLSFPSRAKVIVKNYGELKEALECDQKKQIELGADITIFNSITIRGDKVIDGKNHKLQRGKRKGNVYRGTLFLMLGIQCEWKNVTISGSGNSPDVDGEVFGRLLEARQGKTIFSSGCVWKKNINNRLAVDGGGALWIKRGAQCIMAGGEISYNENVSCGAGVRIEKGGRVLVRGGKICDNRVRGVAKVKGFEGLGAAIYNEGELIIKGGMIKRNKAMAYSSATREYGGAGGAVYNRGVCVIAGGAIQDNYASQRGSAIYADSQSTTELSGGIIASNQDAEKRPIWLDSSCVLGKSATIEQLYIGDSASVRVRSNWNKKKRVLVEPASYEIGLCLLRGAKGNFVLKAKQGMKLERKKDAYYIVQVSKKRKKKALKEKEQKENKVKERKKVLPRGPQIICERKRLVFYEGEYVSKEILCYGVRAQDSNGVLLPISVSGHGIKDGKLNTSRVSTGSITFRAKKSGCRPTKKTVAYEVRANKKPIIRTAPRFFFLDELKELDEKQWKELLWEGLGLEDDCCKREDAVVETQVEHSNINKNAAGKYIVRGCVRDQYGHRYYMKSGEKRRYGKGKRAYFSVSVTVVERLSISKEKKMPQLRFLPAAQTNGIKEEWKFSRETVRDIQQFMEQREDPFSQETNQEFIRRYQKFRK